MATLSRLKSAEISNGNVINADDIEAELDQLVNGHNDHETRVDDLEATNTDLIASDLIKGGKVSGAGVNAQTGTTYTVLTGDRNKLVTHSNASAIAVTLPQAGSTGFASNWGYAVKNLGAGLVTITPTTSTIDGASTLKLVTGQSVFIYSDGSNYFTACGDGPVPLIVVEDQKSSTSDGGTFTSGAMRTRDLNTIVTDTHGIASVSSNQVTLPAGTYEGSFRAPGAFCNDHQAYLYNATDTAYVTGALGSKAFASRVGGVHNLDSVCLAFRFTIASSKAFELHHECAVTQSTNGFGEGSSALNGDNAVYTSITFRKVA